VVVGPAVAGVMALVRLLDLIESNRSIIRYKVIFTCLEMMALNTKYEEIPADVSKWICQGNVCAAWAKQSHQQKDIP